jgi:hypothetical protein
VSEIFHTSQFADAPRSYSNQNQVQVDVDSYIWQPWFVTVDTDVDVAYKIERAAAGEDLDSILLAGGARLGILPFSDYPTSLGYRHRDNRGDGRAGGSDFISDRVDVSSQVIVSSDLRVATLADYEIIDQPGFGEEERLGASLNINKQFETDRLSIGLNYDDADFVSVVDEDERETALVATAVYDTRPFENATSQSTTIAFYETDELTTQTMDRLSFQGLSTLQWRPPELPFTINGALRTLTETIETKQLGLTTTSTETSTQTANGTIGLNYNIRPRLTANAGLNARIESVETEAGGFSGEVPAESRSTAGGSLIGGISYQSLAEPLLSFDWAWNASGSTNLTAETDAGFADQESVAVGHGIARSLDLPFPGRVSFRASEELGLRTATEERFAADLFHNASLSHSSARAGVNTFARLSVSDRRDLVSDDPFEFQLLQFQLNRQETIDLSSSWLANLSFQVSRQKSDNQDAQTVASANGTASYRKADVFGIRNLRFTSELTLNALGLESVLTGEDDEARRRSDRFRSDWINRLEYRIGRIIASLEGSAFYNQGKFGNSLFFRISRAFGGGGGL